MECNICENIKLIYRCYPCFQSLKFINVSTIPATNNSAALSFATFVLKFGCEGQHLRVLESILQPHSIIHAECFESECPPESPEIHLVQPCIVPVIQQCSAPICQAPETYQVTPFPTACPVQAAQAHPLDHPHELHHVPVVAPVNYPVVIQSHYPNPYAPLLPSLFPPTPLPPAPTDNENTDDKEVKNKKKPSPRVQKENDKSNDEAAEVESENEEEKEEKPVDNTVSVFGHTYVNGQLQPVSHPVNNQGASHLPNPYQQPYGVYPAQVPSSPYPVAAPPYGPCHPTCAQVCSTTCHPACCRSRFTPKTRYRAYLQRMRDANKNHI
ncbi:hypothetical protein QZH41_020392, partial [Actinostola sp. cb2023]